MNKMIKNGLWMLAAGMLAVACADYNDLDGFAAEADPSVKTPYSDLSAVKSYIDKDKYPNMTLGTQLKVSDFNKQELAHAAAVTNFNNYAFGTTLMSGTIVNEKGVMNFLSMKELLDHVQEIGGEVYGSPLFANANQADSWLNYLTAPIEIPVDFVEGNSVDFNEMNEGDKYNEGTIVKYDDQNCLKITGGGKVRIISDFEVDPTATYTTTFYARVDKEQSYNIYFSGEKVDGTGADGKWVLKPGKWTKVVVESKSAPDATDGYLRIENLRGTAIYIQKVQVGYYPDNHRPQTEQELKDTIMYAVNTWCDGVMKVNEGRVKLFDLIEEAIDTKAEMESGYYDIKHSTEKIFWQDVLGSEQYGPVVSKTASAKFQDYGGDPSALKFFISENGLEEDKKFESLKHWIKVWEDNGAKIDGINAKLSLVYDEAKTVDENMSDFVRMLDNLAGTGKLIRLSNFDIKYQDADGVSVTATKITEEQRQKLADYNKAVIQTYMNKIPNERQAGICKGNMVDTTDPVGLWAIDSSTKDWVRNAIYKAFCDALSGK